VKNKFDETCKRACYRYGDSCGKKEHSPCEHRKIEILQNKMRKCVNLLGEAKKWSFAQPEMEEAMKILNEYGRVQ